MFVKLRDWLDNRTGFRKVISALLIEHIPGGAKWRYVWGSCLAFVFLVQLITGILLMTAYSPGATTAWSSVYFIQYEMAFGWFIRGLHHFGSQTMVVLLAVHMLQVVIAGAHLPPREVNWWLGLVLMGLILALSLTGYLLPWDQKGFWATQVATNIAGNLPGIGTAVQKIVVGGPEYGNHTLTRFYALHVGILPPLVIVFIVLHLVVFRRHGVTAPKNAQGEGWFWPDQAFRDMVVSLLIFGVMIGLVVYGHGNKVETPDRPAAERTLYDKMAHAGRDGKGANLDAPADPGTDYPARPEWYFLFLFQLLKYFEGHQEIIGTVLIPNGVLLLLALVPLLGYGRMRRFGRVFGIVVVVGLLAGVGALTYLALQEDRADTEKAKAFRAKMAEADRSATRAVNLAHVEGIPAEGAGSLLRRDPLTQGPDLFKQNCAICHAYQGLFGEKAPKPTASDLTDFGTEEWVFRLLKFPSYPAFLGRTGRDKMQGAIDSRFPNVNGLSEEEAKVSDIASAVGQTGGLPNLWQPGWAAAVRKKAEKKLDKDELAQRETDRKELKMIAHWLAAHPRKGSLESGEGWFKEGQQKFTANSCTECHAYEGKGGKSGPDLTGYGGAEWVRVMIMAPQSRSRYGVTNTMPIFRDLESPTADLTRMEIENARDALLAAVDPKNKKAAELKARITKAHTLFHLGDVERELIIRWLLKDYRLVFGGTPIAAPIKR